MLLDAGPDSMGIADTLRRRGVDSLEWVLVSHGHRDHCGGLFELIGKIGIGKIWVGPDTNEQWALDSVYRAARAKGVLMDSLFRGDSLPGLEPWTSRVLWPKPGARVADNGASLVTQIGDNSANFLYVGDLGQEQETALMLLEPSLHTNILQVGHHGSATSSGLPFIGQLSPEYAVICVGENPWGHPRAETLARLSLIIRDSSKILRTDRQGSIRFTFSSGFGFWPD
jgi:competence protein ComEC